jgi:hypothetical protein
LRAVAAGDAHDGAFHLLHLNKVADFPMKRLANRFRNDDLPALT